MHFISTAQLREIQLKLCINIILFPDLTPVMLFRQTFVNSPVFDIFQGSVHILTSQKDT